MKVMKGDTCPMVDASRNRTLAAKPSEKGDTRSLDTGSYVSLVLRIPVPPHPIMWSPPSQPKPLLKSANSHRDGSFEVAILVAVEVFDASKLPSL